MRIRVGAIEFGGSDGPVIQPKDGLSGWWGRPEGSAPRAERESGHGEFDVPLLLGARVVTLRGWIDSDAAGRSRWRDRLSALGADGGRLAVTVSESGESSWAWCRVFDVRVDQASSEHVPEFMVSLRCADPRKYGQERESRSTGGSVSAFHYGSFTATPRFRLTGFVAGYRIVGPGGRRFTVAAPKVFAEVDEVDFATGMVTRNGVPLTRAVTSAQTWGVPSATEVSWRVESLGSGSGEAVAVVRDTWI